jgi:hypothetical protein
MINRDARSDLTPYHEAMLAMTAAAESWRGPPEGKSAAMLDAADAVYRRHGLKSFR